jgi:hypothetical protein
MVAALLFLFGAASVVAGVGYLAGLGPALIVAGVFAIVVAIGQHRAKPAEAP